MRVPVSHRLTAWGMNLALSVWVIEALAVFCATVLIGIGGEAGDTAARLFDSHALALLVAQGAAAAGVLAAVLIRHSLRAEPMVPFEHAWLGSLLTVVLMGSTVYILVVGAKNFESNRVIARQVRRNIYESTVPFKMETRVQEVEYDTDYARQVFKEASADLSIVCTLGAISATGLLILHYLGWRESRALSRGRRRGRVPPWRESRPTP